jgi:hypothetical protein
VVWRRSADAVIHNCTFSSNTAAVNGAGVFQELTRGTLDACILRANKAQVRGLLKGRLPRGHRRGPGEIGRATRGLQGNP